MMKQRLDATFSRANVVGPDLKLQADFARYREYYEHAQRVVDLVGDLCVPGADGARGTDLPHRSREPI